MAAKLLDDHGSDHGLMKGDLVLGASLLGSSSPQHALMANVEIYTWRACPFCIRAKALLDRKGVDYTEYAIDGDEAARAVMASKSGGRRSVPQTFIDGQHVGGCDDLHALERSGQLDVLLGAAA
jgi:glutaredoxin 3